MQIQIQIQIQIEIQIPIYLFGRVIGDGSFSTVYLARDRKSLKEVAIKVCSKEQIIREKKQQVINLADLINFEKTIHIFESIV